MGSYIVHFIVYTLAMSGLIFFALFIYKKFMNGGFVAKGIGQAMDKKQEKLFNISKKGTGINHWLKEVSLKSQKEIIAQGGNVKANLRKLNIAQMSGIAYSAIMLGVLLPKLNIWMTKHKKTNV